MLGIHSQAQGVRRQTVGSLVACLRVREAPFHRLSCFSQCTSRFSFPQRLSGKDQDRSVTRLKCQLDLLSASPPGGRRWGRRSGQVCPRHTFAKERKLPRSLLKTHQRNRREIVCLVKNALRYPSPEPARQFDVSQIDLVSLQSSHSINLCLTYFYFYLLFVFVFSNSSAAERESIIKEG